jgi:hypothetical protein
LQKKGATVTVKEEFERAATTYDGERRRLIPCFDEKALEATWKRMKGDHMATLDDQLLWLKQVGFTDISTWYRYCNFVLFSRTKPLTTFGQHPHGGRHARRFSRQRGS